MTAMQYKCNVCGTGMDCNWPSGVCSLECLRKGQGFMPLSLDQLRNEIMATDNIWTAIERIANSTGMEAGRHLEILLCREIGKEVDVATGRGSGK